MNYEIRRLTPYRNLQDFKDVWGYRISEVGRWRCHIWGCEWGPAVRTLGPMAILGTTHVVCRRCKRSRYGA